MADFPHPKWPKDEDKALIRERVEKIVQGRLFEGLSREQTFARGFSDGMWLVASECEPASRALLTRPRHCRTFRLPFGWRIRLLRLARPTEQDKARAEFLAAARQGYEQGRKLREAQKLVSETLE